MAFTLNIESVDKTTLIDWPSISKTETLTKAPSILRFRIKNYESKTYRPDLNDEVELLNGATRIFGGYVVQTSEEIEGLLKYLVVVCHDYTIDLDRQLAAESYDGMTVDAIIADLATNYLSGFTTTNVNCPTTIDFIQFNYVTVSQCLKKLVSLLGNYDYYIDYNKDIHFFQNTIVPAPFSLTDTNGNFEWNTLKYETNSDQIRNTIIVQGGLVALSTTRDYRFDGDGTKNSWVLADKLDGTPTVTVGGTGKTVGIDGTDADASFQVMWSQANNSIRFTSGNTPGAGTNNVVVTGYPLYPLVAIFENNASVVAYGVKQFLIQDKTILTQAAAEQRASAEILKYANPTYRGTFETETDGLVVGQTLTVNSTIRSINSSFKITNIRTIVKNPTGALKYFVTFVSADPIGINDVLNKLLILDPSESTGIPTNTVIQIIKQITEGVSIADALSAPTSQVGPYKWGAQNNVIDSYSEANRTGDSSQLFSSANPNFIGQTFSCSITSRPTKATLYLSKIGSPTGSAVAKLYALTGTSGTDGKPTGAVLVASASVDVSTLSTSPTLTDFTFSTTFSLSAGVTYCLALDCTGVTGSAGNGVLWGRDTTSPSHSGNEFLSGDGGSTFTTVTSVDLCFYVYGDYLVWGFGTWNA